MLWRASLLALGCVAPPKKPAPAALSSGSKLPRHSKPAPTFLSHQGRKMILSGLPLFTSA
ncbi:hypothetical protein EUX58_11090 [Pseudomonas sp. 770NI]|nr:hypothetical protein EUX58_11090 [Pseudomonas sp. 770NI]